ncbi:MAG: cation:proton antiporter [Candidatus Thermoplasmatota archaeon]|nr:cation:proton antiporter [Candidatus Thermoplasmatota archaeon]
MIPDSELFFQFGIIMLLAFIGAGIASRLGQSVILGYIAVGALIGPFIRFTLFGYTYTGLIQNTELLSYFAKMGLVLLLFFVGLEFSISKLKKTKTAATILAVFNLAVDMFFGVVIGTYMRWPLEDVFFLAAIVATGSSAVAAKGIMEIGKLSAPETEFIIGMSVVEDFIAMLLLTIAGGLMTRTSGGPSSIWQLMSFVGIFYLFFVILAVIVVPRVLRHIEVIKNDEMFILFALGIVFISVALADALYVESLIGAFFIGMVFAETSMTERLKEKLMSMRDAFVAIFFIYFGMLIDPSVLMQVVPLLLLAVPMMLMSDIILTSCIAMLIGFPSKHAFFVGASSAFRGAESLLFASVGGSAMGVKYSRQLYAIAGPFSLIMDLIALPVLKKSSRLTSRLAAIVPEYMRFTSSLISRTFSKLVMPQSLQIYGNAKRTTLPLWSFIISSAIAIFFSYPLRLVPMAVAGLSAFLSVSLLKKDLHSSINLINYANIGVTGGSSSEILSLIMKLVSGLLISVISVIGVAAFYIPLGLIPISLYVAYMMKTMNTSYKKLIPKMRLPYPNRATFSGSVADIRRDNGFVKYPASNSSIVTRVGKLPGANYAFLKLKKGAKEAKNGFEDGIYPPGLK